jgi:hypothetical protein
MSRDPADEEVSRAVASGSVSGILSNDSCIAELQASIAHGHSQAATLRTLISQVSANLGLHLDPQARARHEQILSSSNDTLASLTTAIEANERSLANIQRRTQALETAANEYLHGRMSEAEWANALREYRTQE